MAMFRYDKTRDEFHTMMGYCIAAWAEVDDQLFRIFHHCLGARTKQAAILYYRIGGIETRLNTVEEMVRSVLPQKSKKSGEHDHDDVKRWSKIKNKASNVLLEPPLLLRSTPEGSQSQ